MTVNQSDAYAPLLCLSCFFNPIVCFVFRVLTRSLSLPDIAFSRATLAFFFSRRRTCLMASLFFTSLRSSFVSPFSLSPSLGSPLTRFQTGTDAELLPPCPGIVPFWANSCCSLLLAPRPGWNGPEDPLQRCTRSFRFTNLSLPASIETISSTHDRFCGGISTSALPGSAATYSKFDVGEALPQLCILVADNTHALNP